MKKFDNATLALKTCIYNPPLFQSNIKSLVDEAEKVTLEQFQPFIPKGKEELFFGKAGREYGRTQEKKEEKKE